MSGAIHDAVRVLRARLRSSISGRSSKLAPDTLWHYTTAGGFEAIVRTKTLRATNFSFLNDPSELAYGVDLVRWMFTEVLGKKYPNLMVHAFLARTLANLNIELLSEIHVCCFTGKRDDLSQWRAYGGGASEKYALGFDRQMIKDATRKRDDARFLRVIYDPAEQERRVRLIAERAIEVVKTVAAREFDAEPFAEVVAERLARLLPAFKSPAFAGEDEWRITICRSLEAPSDVEVDTSRGVLRPYVNFRFPDPEPIPVKSLLVLAPTRADAALKAANVVLRRAGILQAPPKHSDVPFAD